MGKLLTTSEAAQIAGVSEDTIRRWDSKGLIISNRTSGMHRRYNKESVLAYASIKSKNKNRHSVAYVRLDSSEDSELLNKRIESLESYCKSKNISYELIYDIGCNLDFKRKGILKLIMLIETNRIDKIILIDIRDLCVIGHELFIEICKYHNVEIISLPNTLR